MRKSPTSAAVTSATAGISEKKAAANKTARIKAGDDCSYTDVKRACHAWLMRNDYGYAQMQDAFSKGEYGRAKLFAGF